MQATFGQQQTAPVASQSVADDIFADLLPAKATSSSQPPGNAGAFSDDAVLPIRIDSPQSGMSSASMDPSGTARDAPRSSSQLPMGDGRTRRGLKEHEQVLQDIVDGALRSFGAGLQQVLGDINRRLESLEGQTERLGRTLADAQDTAAKREEARQERLHTLDRSLQAILRSVQLVRDKQELADAQAQLAAHLAARGAAAAAEAGATPADPAAPAAGASTATAPEVQARAPPPTPMPAPTPAAPSPAPPVAAPASMPAAAVASAPPAPVPVPPAAPAAAPPAAAALPTAPELVVSVPPVPQQQTAPVPVQAYTPAQQQQAGRPQPVASAPQQLQYAAPPPAPAPTPVPPPPPQAYSAPPVLPLPPHASLPMSGAPGMLPPQRPPQPYSDAGTAPPPPPPPPPPMPQLPPLQGGGRYEGALVAPLPSLPASSSTGQPGYGLPYGSQAHQPYPSPPMQLQQPYGMAPGQRYGGDSRAAYGASNPPPARPASFGRQNSSSRSQGSGGAGGTRSMPLQQVIDEVANMGFDRHEVRGVIDKLMASGQSIDLNVVIDRLTNGMR